MRGSARPGDVILTVDGADARVLTVWRGFRAGRVTALRLHRDGRERDLRVTVGPAPTPQEVEHRLRLQVACLRRGFARAASEAEWIETNRACHQEYGF